MARSVKADIFFEYLLAFVLVQYIWLAIFFNIFRPEVYIFVFVFILHLRKFRSITIGRPIFIIGLIYVFLAILQGIIWDFSIVSLITSFTFGFLLPYLLYKTYGIKFLFTVADVVKVLVYISFAIWLLHQLIPAAEKIILSLIDWANVHTDTEEYPSRSMFFYTYWSKLGHFYGFSRNAGFESEPATYSLYILFVIIVNYVKQIPLISRRNIILYLALFSSMSTSGYIAFGVLTLLLVGEPRYRMLGIFVFVAFTLFSLLVLRDLEFMEEKIEQQISEQTSMSLNEPTSGRLFSARKSFYVLFKYPFYGRGLLTASKPTDMSDPEFAGYGWYSYISRFGLVFGGIFMYIYFKGIYSFASIGRISFTKQSIIALVFFIMFSAQSYMTSSIFMIFFFTGLYHKRHRLLIKNIKTL